MPVNKPTQDLFDVVGSAVPDIETSHRARVLVSQFGACAQFQDEHFVYSSLFDAAEMGKTQTAKFLMKSGADPELQNRRGLNSADYAVLHGNTETADAIYDAWLHKHVSNGIGFWAERVFAHMQNFRNLCDDDRETLDDYYSARLCQDFCELGSSMRTAFETRDARAFQDVLHEMSWIFCDKPPRYFFTVLQSWGDAAGPGPYRDRLKLLVNGDFGERLAGGGYGECKGMFTDEGMKFSAGFGRSMASLRIRKQQSLPGGPSQQFG